MRRIPAALVLACVLALAPWAAYADDFPDPGLGDSDFDFGGDPSAGMGIPGWFVAIFVLVMVGGVALSVYRVTSARSMARRAGLDPDDATRATLLGEDGYSATYLASQLRGQQRSAESPPAAHRSVAQRLRELDGLRDQGLVTDEEYAARRTAILGDV